MGGQKRPQVRLRLCNVMRFVWWNSLFKCMLFARGALIHPPQVVDNCVTNCFLPNLCCLLIVCAACLSRALQEADAGVGAPAGQAQRQ
jgi:hypothetical protein